MVLQKHWRSQEHNLNLPKTILHIAGWGRVKGPVDSKQKAY